MNIQTTYATIIPADSDIRALAGGDGFALLHVLTKDSVTGEFAAYRGLIHGRIANDPAAREAAALRVAAGGEKMSERAAVLIWADVAGNYRR